MDGVKKNHYCKYAWGGVSIIKDFIDMTLCHWVIDSVNYIKNTIPKGKKTTITLKGMVNWIILWLLLCSATLIYVFFAYLRIFGEVAPECSTFINENF